MAGTPPASGGPAGSGGYRRVDNPPVSGGSGGYGRVDNPPGVTP